MAFNEVYDCQILISEIERRPALYDCSWKNAVIRVWKRDCGKKCARHSFLSGVNWTAQRNMKKLSSIVFNIFNTNEQVYIILL